MAMLKSLKTAGRWALELLALIAIGIVVAFMLTVAFAPSALAAGTTANLSWTLPSTWSDGSTLSVSDLKETLIEWRRTAAGPVVGSVRVTAPASSVSVPGLACGDFVFTASAVAKSTALYPNSQSASSSPPAAYATGVECRPNPPTGLTAS